MASTFTKTQLFGGAITANIPSEFADVSTIRQVPDHQEVYLDTAGFTSLVFDITERVSHLSTDKAALEYHFADTVAEGDTKEIFSVAENVKLPKFSPTTPILSLTATTTPPPDNNPRPLTPTHTNIHLTLIRLVDQSTDVVITLNVPQIPSVEGQQVSDEKTMEEVRKEVVRSFEIKDWELFDGEHAT